MALNNEIFKRFNILAWDTDALYHKISLALGITDSELNILYVIYFNGGKVRLSDIVRYSGLMKQTVNSSLRKLEEKKILTLENVDGKSKAVSLTSGGFKLCENTVKHLIEWEDKALSSFSSDEMELYLSLMEKYLTSMSESLKAYEKELPPKID